MVGTQIHDHRPSQRLPVGRVDCAFGNRKVDLPIVVAYGVQVADVFKAEIDKALSKSSKADIAKGEGGFRDTQ
jgi:hypothetical protein